MDKQILIALGRTCGSGGHVIAERIAEHFGISLYDKNILKHIADENNSDYEELVKYDEKKRNIFLSRKYNEHNASMEDVLAQMQADFIKEKAASGESFVVVGRCADVALHGNENLITIFVNAEDDARIKRIMTADKLSEKEAKVFIEKKDKQRRNYHNSHGVEGWGDATTYDICISSSYFGIEETADFLCAYIEKRMAKLK